MTTSATPAGRRSFTLLELLLVLVILSLAAALVFPRLGPAGRRIGVRSASYDLLWLLRQARWWSMSTGQTCLVDLRPVAGGYAADVKYLAGPDAPAQPLRDEWACLEQLFAVKRLMQIPPDMGISRRKELTVRFTPWGVNEDYVIELAEGAGGGGTRIEVRRPSGLVWLVPAEEPGPFDPGSLSAIEQYWERHCRNLNR
jgi:prepilin-type N-terminal cleavage/methylation domain-containing protein